MRFIKLLLPLLLALPLPAQTVAAPTWFPLGTLSNTFDFPAGKFTLQYGCSTKLTLLTITGPQTNRQFGTGSCPIQVQEQSIGFNVGVHTWNGTTYALTSTLKVPASGTPPPPPPPPTSITIPANGTCTATINKSPVPCTFTINASGNITITAGTLGITVKP